VSGPGGSLRAGFRYCLTVFVAVRVGLLVLGLVAVAVIPALDPVSVPGWTAHAVPDPGWHNLFTAWERFDALWFLRIAAEGYRAADGSAAFFPLYPLVTRFVSVLIGGHPFAAALLVSNGAFLGALVMLYALTRSELSDEVARATVLFVAVFPTSLFFFAPYSESLFLLLAVTAMWAARRDRWVLAAAAGAGAALTRNVGAVVALALAAEALERRREGKPGLVPGLAAAAGAAIGTLLYLGYWATRGDTLAPLSQQANWERVFSWPWVTLWEGTKVAFRYVGNTNGGYWLVDWLVVVPMLCASVFALARYRWMYKVYLLGGLLVPLTFVFEGRPLMSMPRFLLPLFPAFWALAEVTRRMGIPRWAVAVVGAAGLGMLTLLFVNWYYIF
jgi:hypothetical protein